MNLICTFVIICCVSACGASTTTTTKPEITEEDLRIVKESIAKYGPVQDFRELGLPGPEMVARLLAHTFTNTYEFDNETGNYTLRFRGMTPLFSYNRRYEVGTNGKIGEDPIVKGQFSEHFTRNSSGLYLRTIGYILDKDGYREFLLDVSKGEFPKTVKRISSAALASLTGGGLG